MKVRYAVFAVLFLGSFAFSQDRPTVTAQANTLYVSAEGKFEADPDTAQIQFNIAAQEETSAAAYQHASRAATRMRELLRANEIDPKSAEVSFYSLQPMYDWKTAKNKIAGYRVSANVAVKLHDFSKVGQLVQGLAGIEETESQSLSYILENLDAAKIKAAEDGLHRARNLAAAVAKAGGRTLAELVYSSVDTFDQIRPLIMGSAGKVVSMGMRPEAVAEPTAEFSPKKIVVTAHVNALFGLR